MPTSDPLDAAVAPPLDAASGRVGAPSELRLALILGGLAALGPLSVDMYLPSFPALARSLGVSVAAVQLTLAAFLAGLALGQLVYGPLSDRLGRRAPLLAGLGLYVVASFACSVAPSLPLLIAARFVQALGGCAGMVITRAVVRDRFDERASARLYSSLMLVMGVAPIVAPIVGGQLLLVAGWRAIFVVLAAAGTAALLAIAVALPESLAPDARARHGVRSTLQAFVALLGERRFLRLSVAGGVSQGAMFAYISGSPFVFIELLHVPAERYGLIFGANAFGLIAASQVNRWLVPRAGVVPAFQGAVVVSVFAYAALFTAIRLDAGLYAILPPLWLGIASLGITMPNVTAVAMAPHGARAGSASALLGTVQTACGALASAAVSALANGTARPMATVMLGCGLVALVLVRR